MGEHRELLPGIPDQITLAQIAPKLPWTAFHSLSSVSQGWREAIQTHEVYNARIRAKSTETLVVHIHSHEGTEALALYSTRDKCCYELPPIPHLEDRIPMTCQCIALDGKLYVLGGEETFGTIGVGSAGVCVFDVAGQRRWRLCASMQEPKSLFACGVVQGKIFVFGGATYAEPFFGSEVFNPEQNSWSTIAHMPSRRCKHQVATVGTELVVYRGYFHNGRKFYNPVALDVYDPSNDEWRLVEPAGERCRCLAMAKGKLYSITKRRLDVYNFETDSWTNQHSNRFPGNRSVTIEPTALFAVDDEVVMAAHRSNTANEDHGTYLFQSVGFGSGRKNLEWQKIPCPFPRRICSCRALYGDTMCSIEL